MNKIVPIKHFENLDALRDIACLAVVFFHLPTYLVIDKNSTTFRFLSVVFSFNGQGGQLGVFFFFTLSGFLITYLLFTEKFFSSTINIVHFYLRRVLRIWPMYFMILFIAFILSPLICNFLGYSYIEKSNPISYIFFVSNFDVIYNALPTNKILGTLWSVAVEEQFYLIWPLLMLIISVKNSKVIFTLLFCLSLLFIIYNFHNEQIIYYHTISAILYLSFGAIMANFCFYEIKFINKRMINLPKKYILLIYITSIIVLFFNNQIQNSFIYWRFLSKIFSVLFFSFIIVEQIYSPNSFFKFGKIGFLNYSGKISYGIYLLHLIAIYIVHYLSSEFNLNVILQIFLILVLTYALSSISYFYYEKPFIKLKSRFSPNK